jgi:molybdate transport system ATP-binding protein
MIDVNFRKRLPALQLDIAFTARTQGITALFGRSGSGKTSIVQAIAGGLRPDDGRIGIDDRVFFDSATGIDLAVHHRRIGYVFQDSRLFPHLTVRGNLLYGHRRAGDAQPLDPDDVIALLGIAHLLERRPHHLSGGERQRVAIGRALLAQPTLLLMDEPLASLDPPRKSELLPYIERLRDEYRLPIIYISHVFDEVVRLADELVLIEGGRVLRAGPLQEVASEPASAPLIGRFEAGAVLECTVVGHDRPAGLTALGFAGGQLQVPLVDLEVGSRLRVRLRSRDVAIGLSRASGISISNQLAGRLVSLTPRDLPFVDVAIDVGGVLLRALVTAQSVERLRLVPGMPVWALIKTVSFDSRSVGFIRRARPITNDPAN